MSGREMGGNARMANSVQVVEPLTDELQAICAAADAGAGGWVTTSRIREALATQVAFSFSNTSNTLGDAADAAGLSAPALRASAAIPIAEMVNRFLGWPLPKTFAPDCGISFDGRKDDQWNKNKSWPVGTNLFTADEARAMLEHVLGVLK